MTSSLELHPDQAQLVERLLARGRVRLALSGPPGTGKTRAVLVAVERLVADDPSATVLVVAPSALGSYMGAVLKETAGGIGLQRLKGADLRVRGETGSSLASGVYFVTIELARQPWAREVVASVPWSLAFVDEASFAGESVNHLIDQLSASPGTQRLCVVFDGIEPRIPRGLDLVTWDAAQFRRIPRRAEVISYERSREEVSARNRLDVIEREFGADAFTRSRLESAWRSSTSAFEFVLARELSLPPYISSKWSDRDGAATALQQLLAQVGETGRDSKLEAFLIHAESRVETTRLAVFTGMRQTALYLHAALEARGIPASVIDGSRPFSERIAPENVRVVVLTDAVAPAVDLSSGFDGVSYDLPWEPARIEARWASLGDVGDEAVMSILSDTSATDATERELARRIAAVRELFGDVPDLLRSDID